MVLLFVLFDDKQEFLCILKIITHITNYKSNYYKKCSLKKS